MDVMIRPVHAADAAAICGIYNPYVLHTVVSFEEEAVAPEEMARRIDEGRRGGAPLARPRGGGRSDRLRLCHPLEGALGVPVRRGELDLPGGVGRAGRGMAPGCTRSCWRRCRTRPLRTVIGGVALPNDASVRLHEKLGFRKVAHFERVGWKCGRWVDVGYWQLSLRSSGTRVTFRGASVVDLAVVPGIDRERLAGEDDLIDRQARGGDPRRRSPPPIPAVFRLDDQDDPLSQISGSGIPTAATRRMRGSSPCAACSTSCGWTSAPARRIVEWTRPASQKRPAASKEPVSPMRCQTALVRSAILFSLTARGLR